MKLHRDDATDEFERLIQLAVESGDNDRAEELRRALGEYRVFYRFIGAQQEWRA